MTSFQNKAARRTDAKYNFGRNAAIHRFTKQHEDMNHEENTLILSYYIFDMIPTRSLEILQQRRNTSTSTVVANTDIIISLPATQRRYNGDEPNECIQSFVSPTIRRLYNNSIADSNHGHEIAASDYVEESGSERMIPWVVDEWTIQDEEEAATRLNDAADKCRITEQDYKTKQFRYIKSDAMAWNKFYQNHQANFFKDRHYFVKEFPLEFTLPLLDSTVVNRIGTESNDTTQQHCDNNESTATAATIRSHHRCLVEIGCGVGNAMLPLLGMDGYSVDDGNYSHNSNSRNEEIEWTVYGFDLSCTAIEMLRGDPRYQQAVQKNRAHCDVCDVSIPNALPSYVHNVANVASLIFCLSAIHPTKQAVVLQNVIATLQPGIGTLIFRDYGRYDLAQIKLGIQRSKLLPDTDNFYRKHDGTKCYYFTLQDMEQLVRQQNGMLEILELQYIRRKYINRSMRDGERRRVWVQGRFRRTMKRNIDMERSLNNHADCVE